MYAAAIRLATRYMTRAQFVLGQPLDRDAAALAGQRHGLGALDDRHPAAHPRPRQVEVLAAGRRADPGQLGMDRRAVVALLVVLGDDLPVGGELVGVARDDRQVFGAVRRRRPPRAGDVRRRSRRPHRWRSTNNQPCQLTSRSSARPNCVGLEALDVAEARRVAQRCRPAGTTTSGTGRRWRGRLVGRIARQQFVAAVPAGVGERAHHVVLVADQQHAVRSGADRLLRAPRRRGRQAWPTHIQPGRRCALLPREHRRIDVRLAGQHAGLARTAPATRQRPRSSGAGAGSSCLNIQSA